MKRGEPFPSSILKYMRTYMQRFGFSYLLFDIYSRIRSSTTTTAGFTQQPQPAVNSDLQHNSSECNATPELSGPPAGMGPMHHKPPTHLRHPPPHVHQHGPPQMPQMQMSPHDHRCGLENLYVLLSFQHPAASPAPSEPRGNEARSHPI
ncbi:hypothetical protein quinque_006646 [Culex quinquefasciatus]|uniref:uncharacterized protein LOC119770745 n=1 Tax=Culex quinquefasciatus TaxID=7176 RepID=UPI0018E2E1DB|nr:uncharacterized protein LOC119770745 [Culex quinquefasciatus]XP_038122104.1 uncharacterized protein LOC119770745 [Culex quinquefasciatus]XP_039434822.1 uncharacterized protein LOC120416966 [Culex pipiens pallens]